MKEEIVNFYKKYNQERRFKKVKNGLWIHPKEVLKGYGKFKEGIFINEFDFNRNKEYTFKVFLYEVDDALRIEIDKKSKEVFKE